MNWKGKQTLFVHLTAASAWIERPSNCTTSVYSKNKYLLSFFFGIALNDLTKQQAAVLTNVELTPMSVSFVWKDMFKITLSWTIMLLLFYR